MQQTDVAWSLTRDRTGDKARASDGAGMAFENTYAGERVLDAASIMFFLPAAMVVSPDA